MSSTIVNEKPLPLWLRAILWIGVGLVLISVACLVAILVFYFTDGPESPTLFFINLFVFPLGFFLILVHLAGTVIVRRRRARSLSVATDSAEPEFTAQSRREQSI